MWLRNIFVQCESKRETLWLLTQTGKERQRHKERNGEERERDTSHGCVFLFRNENHHLRKNRVERGNHVVCWSDTTLQIHDPTQFWVYLVTTIKYCIDTKSFISNNKGASVGWCLRGQTSFWQATTINSLYQCSSKPIWWLSSKAEQDGKCIILIMNGERS